MILRFYRALHYLSIDIVLGAAILLHFFSKPFEIPIPWSVYTLLASSIWLIYTIDHLRDSISSQYSARARYVFHSKNKDSLKIAIVSVVVLSAISLFFLPQSILISGGILSFFCLTYIFFQPKLAGVGLKELYVALIYSLGIMLAPVSLKGEFHAYLFAILLILAFLNLTMFSWFDHGDDSKDSFKSIATVLGVEQTQKLIVLMSAVGLAIGFSGLQYSFLFSIYFIVVLFVYIFIALNPIWARKEGRYRTIGDGVFLLPILFEML